MPKILAYSIIIILTIGAFIVIFEALCHLFPSIINFNLADIAASLLMIFISVCILLGLLPDEEYEELKEWL